MSVAVSHMFMTGRVRFGCWCWAVSVCVEDKTVSWVDGEKHESPSTARPGLHARPWSVHGHHSLCIFQLRSVSGQKVIIHSVSFRSGQ